MKAVVLHSTFAPFHVARLEAAGVDARKRGHSLVAIQVAGTQSDYLWPSLRPEALSVPLVTLFPDDELYSLPQRGIRLSLQSALDQIQPEVAVLPGWGFRHSLVGLGWCLRNNRAAVVCSDSHPVGKSDPWHKRVIKRVLVQHFDAAFVAGHAHARHAASLGIPAERCFLGYDVVDNAQFSQVPHRAQPSEPPVLLSCLRLLPRKNALGVLDGLKLANQEWAWIVAGDGPQLEPLRRRASDLGLSERITFLGHVQYSQLPAVYARADVYLQPSLYEPWGLAVNEAMASGLPVLVSEQCGSKELVAAGVNGFVFDALRRRSLAASLDSMHARRDSWTEMGQASRRIINSWGLDRYAQSFWDACESALAARTLRRKSLTAAALKRVL